eukprot:m51a1_g7651 putative protein-tyrosine-phosphatase mkp1-like isoform x1 (679) ;mRNA; r:388280-390316
MGNAVSVSCDTDPLALADLTACASAAASPHSAAASAVPPLRPVALAWLVASPDISAALPLPLLPLAALDSHRCYLAAALWPDALRGRPALRVASEAVSPRSRRGLWSSCRSRPSGAVADLYVWCGCSAPALARASAVALAGALERALGREGAVERALCALCVRETRAAVPADCPLRALLAAPDGGAEAALLQRCPEAQARWATRAARPVAIARSADDVTVTSLEGPGGEEGSAVPIGAVKKEALRTPPSVPKLALGGATGQRKTALDLAGLRGAAPEAARCGNGGSGGNSGACGSGGGGDESPKEELPRAERERIRGEMSEVLDGWLMIGGDVVASDEGFLRQRGVTHVLNCACRACPAYFPQSFRYLVLDLLDDPSEDVVSLFPHAVAWLERARLSGGVVLVHCFEGVSRSATFVMAYLMWARGIDREQALRFLHRARPIVDPKFIGQLILWDRRLQPLAASQLFQVVPHPKSRHELVLVGSEVRRPSRSSLDPRGCFVLLAPDSTAYTWTGADCRPMLVGGGSKIAEQLCRFRGATTVVEVSQGAEPAGFWEALGDSAGPVVESPQYAAVYALAQQSPDVAVGYRYPAWERVTMAPYEQLEAEASQQVWVVFATGKAVAVWIPQGFVGVERGEYLSGDLLRRSVARRFMHDNALPADCRVIAFATVADCVDAIRRK